MSCPPVGSIREAWRLGVARKCVRGPASGVFSEPGSSCGAGRKIHRHIHRRTGILLRPWRDQEDGFEGWGADSFPGAWWFIQSASPVNKGPRRCRNRAFLSPRLSRRRKRRRLLRPRHSLTTDYSDDTDGEPIHSDFIHVIRGIRGFNCIVPTNAVSRKGRRDRKVSDAVFSASSEFKW